MKRALLLLFVFLIAAMAAGCTKESEEEMLPSKLNIDAEEMADYIIEKIEFEDEMNKVEADIFFSLYNLEEKSVKEAYVYMSTGATAEEVAVIKVSSQEEKERVSGAIESRIDSQRKAFKDYVPKELEKIDNSYIVSFEDMVILIVSNDSTAAGAAINDYIGKQ